MLTPASWLYGVGAWVRNMLYDKGVFRQEKFDIPVLCVGNLSVGGTGKTPHVEMIVRNLASDVTMAVLSRGYKRATKGFVLANPKSTPREIGDEPMQIYSKFGSMVKVAVCESRAEGIRRLMKLYPQLELIVLDDAFQHRSVKPTASVLLMDYALPTYEDRLLPLGRLREQSNGIYRAEFVVVTKCPSGMTPLDVRLIRNELQLMSFQKLFFSRMEYGQLSPVFSDEAKYHVTLSGLTAKDSVMVMTGIANPRPLVRHLKIYPFRKKICHYPDHHEFSKKDIEDIERRFNKMKGEHRIILTTEKDAMRLQANPYFPHHLKPFTFYIPVSVRMVPGQEDGDFMTAVRDSLGFHTDLPDSAIYASLSPADYDSSTSEDTSSSTVSDTSGDSDSSEESYPSDTSSFEDRDFTSGYPSDGHVSFDDDDHESDFD